MAILAAFNGQAQDIEGNIITNFQVEVKDESTSTLASLFSDRNGSDPISNPFIPDPSDNGYFRFHVAGGAYRIRVFTNEGDVAIWRYVGIGTASELDATDPVSLTIGGAFNPPALLAIGDNESATAVSSTSIPAPADIEDGDYLLLKMTWDGTVSNVNLPSGFSWVIAPFSDSANQVTMGIAAKFADGESGSYAVSWTGTQEYTADLLRFDNVDPDNPVEAFASTAGSSAGTSHTAPSVTTTRRNTRVIRFWGLDDNDTPYAVSDTVDVDTPDVNRAAGSNGPGSVVYTQVIYTGAAAGTKILTSALAEEWVAATIALNPVEELISDGDLILFDGLTDGFRSAGDLIRTRGGSVIIGRVQDADVSFEHPPKGKLIISGGGSHNGPDITENAALFMESHQDTGTYIELLNDQEGDESNSWNMGAWGPQAFPGGVEGSFSIFDHNAFQHRIFCGSPDNDSFISIGLDAVNDPGIVVIDSDVFFAVDTTASAANAVLVGGNNQLLRSTSSSSIKTDVEPILQEFADKVLELEPVWFRSTAKGDITGSDGTELEKSKWSFWGLIAEDVAKVDPRLVHWIHPAVDKRPWKKMSKKAWEVEPTALEASGVQYERIGVLLINVVKRLKAKVEQLEAEISALKK